ncbi:uncharacterized protein LOC21397054 isoform X2 [Morus notabilis]|uniref:uncharacterized protein LOC21397054 isoform X2 n=1 Tax=Morus notabilis TaxID=981085 RepID=UPI000CED2E74|nr:uncharacterized protein LOC21397054 isoform X2 [Morus notabilis]
MKRSSTFNLESSMKRQRQMDGLVPVELVWKKDEIAIRRPTTTIPNSTQMNNTPNYLLAATSTNPTTNPPHKNYLHFGLFPDHRHHHERFVVSAHRNTFKDDKYVNKFKKLSQLKTPLGPVPGDSHIVPDNDYDQQHPDHFHKYSQVLGHYLSTTDDHDHVEKIMPRTTKLQQAVGPPVVRSSYHDHDHVNSRQVPYYSRCRSSNHVNIDDDGDRIGEYNNNCKIKRGTSSSSSSSKATSRRGSSTRRRASASGLLNFVTTTEFSTSPNHQLLDGRPAVVATTSANYTTSMNSLPLPKPITIGTNYYTSAGVKSPPPPPPDDDHDNQTVLLLVPTNDDGDDDQHSQAADPLASINSKQKHSAAESPNDKCDEALVPSFSVCSNDPINTNHQDDSEPCPCNKSVGEEPQLRLPPSTSNKAPPTSRAAKRKAPATALHNLSERRRRDKINKKMRALQALIPNCNKVKKASILDEAIAYMRTLQLQLQIPYNGGATYCCEADDVNGNSHGSNASKSNHVSSRQRSTTTSTFENHICYAAFHISNACLPTYRCCCCYFCSYQHGDFATTRTTLHPPILVHFQQLKPDSP